MSISTFLNDQRQLLRDFYHLDYVEDYWQKHGVEEGIPLAMQEATELVKDKVVDTHPVVQMRAAQYTAVSNLYVGLAVGLYSWGKQTAVELVGKGAGPALCKAVEVPVSGLVQGAQYVGYQGVRGFDVGRQIYHGETVEMSPWETTYEAVSTLGVAWLTVMGVKGLAKGIDTIGKDPPSFGFEPALAYATSQGAVLAGPSRLAVDLGGFGKGLGEVGSGAVMMASASQPAGGEGKSEAVTSSGRGSGNPPGEDPFVSLPGGRTVRGSKIRGVSFGDESPVHAVELSPFRLGKTPATTELWLKYWTEFRHTPWAVIGGESKTGIWRVVQRGETERELGTWVKEQRDKGGVINNGEFEFESATFQVHRVIPKEVLPSPKGFDGWTQPVVKVNWAESVAASDGIGRIFNNGKPGHLPTEAQWESAARWPLVDVARQMKAENVRSDQLTDFVMGPEIVGRFDRGRFGRYENFVEIVDPDAMTFGVEIFTDPNHPTVRQWLDNGRLGAFRVFPTESGAFDSSIASSVFEQRSATRPVAEGTPNASGLLDMSGNVLEWGNGLYQENAYRVRLAADPIGPVGINDTRVLRGGGSWGDGYSYPRYFCSGQRRNDYPVARDRGHGFRPAWSQD